MAFALGVAGTPDEIERHTRNSRQDLGSDHAIESISSVVGGAGALLLEAERSPRGFYFHLNGKCCTILPLRL